MENKYSALRLIASINIIVGWGVIIIGSIATLQAMSTAGFIIGVPILIGSLFFGLILIASAQIIQVIIDIEANTRSASINLIPDLKVNFPDNNKSVTTRKFQASSPQLTDDEKLQVESSLKKLTLNGYACDGFDIIENKWRLRSTVNSAEFDLSYKQLIDLANNF